MGNATMDHLNGYALLVLGNNPYWTFTEQSGYWGKLIFTPLIKVTDKFPFKNLLSISADPRYVLQR